MYLLYALPSMLSSGFTSDSSLWSLLYYTSLQPALPLVFYSISLLLLSYYTMSIPCLISLAIYLLAFVCLCSRHDFQCLFMIRIYRYTCVYLCTPLGIRITTCWGVLTPLNPHVQVSKLGACEFSQMLIRDAQLKRGSLADCPKPYPSRSPVRLSSFPYVNSWAPFVLFILVHLLVFSQLRLWVI